MGLIYIYFGLFKSYEDNFCISCLYYRVFLSMESPCTSQKIFDLFSKDVPILNSSYPKNFEIGTSLISHQNFMCFYNCTRCIYWAHLNF